MHRGNCKRRDKHSVKTKARRYKKAVERDIRKGTADRVQRGKTPHFIHLLFGFGSKI